MSAHVFAAYIDALRRLNAKCATFLQPGYANAGEGVRAAYPELVLHDDIAAMWRTFNGIAPTGQTPLGDIWLDGTFYFFSEGEAIDDYSSSISLHGQEGFSDYWPLGFFPVGTPGDGSRLLVNCILGSPTQGAVYELMHGVGVYRRALSLSRHFETALVSLERGATRVSQQGRLEQDEVRFRAIARELNPGCDGWDENLVAAYESKDWKH